MNQSVKLDGMVQIVKISAIVGKMAARVNLNQVKLKTAFFREMN